MGRPSSSVYRRAGLARHAFVLIVAGGLAGSASFPMIAAADVKLGVLIPASGKGGGYGEQQKAAMDVFLAKYGDLGSLGRLQLLIGDTRGENVEAINLARKMISSDDVVALVGPQFSAEAEVTFPIAARARTPIVTPMAAKAGIVAASRPWAFRFALTTENTYGPLVDAWRKKYSSPEIRKVVLFMDSKDAVSAYDGKTVFPKVLKDRNIEILDTITFQTGDIDYSAQVTRAKALNPEGIVISSLYNEGGNLVRELAKQDLRKPTVVGVGANNPRFIELGGAAAEGVFAASDFFDSNKRPDMETWVADFRKRLNVQPTNAAGEIYDTLYLMRQCIVAGKAPQGDLQAQRDAIRDCWNDMKNADAPLTGQTTMQNGDAVRQPAILTVRDKRFVLDE